MKTRSILPVLAISVAVIGLTSCSSEKKEAADVAAPSAVAEKTSEPQFQVDTKFQAQLAVVFTAYVELKDAFVSSKPDKVKKEATGVMQELEQTDMALLSGAAHNDWMSYLAPMQSSIKEILATDDIEIQRKAFSTLSGNLYKSVKAFGLGGKLAYYEYCPMAFNNEGAYWLSDQTLIRNPYFGDRMLTCGNVEETLK